MRLLAELHARAPRGRYSADAAGRYAGRHPLPDELIEALAAGEDHELAEVAINRGSGAGLNVGDRRYPGAFLRALVHVAAVRTRSLLRASGHELGADPDERVSSGSGHLRKPSETLVRRAIRKWRQAHPQARRLRSLSVQGPRGKRGVRVDALNCFGARWGVRWVDARGRPALSRSTTREAPGPAT